MELQPFWSTVENYAQITVCVMNSSASTTPNSDTLNVKLACLYLFLCLQSIEVVIMIWNGFKC